MTETMGQFRLIQKLGEDALGELYCAAWPLGAGPAEEETVLLRLFDAQGFEPERFLERIAERQARVGARISDHLATSSHLGVADGRAFDAAPYTPGQTLASMIRLATKHRLSVPPEVALYIVARLAAGLGTASRQAAGGDGLLHGFLTSDLVMVSEEGEVRLCGLEAAPALREYRANAAAFARILPYLSPESTNCDEPHPSDDVYSLGALLFELVTLRPPASHADLRAEQTAIPSELRYLLDRSLAPRFRRIQSVVDWLRELKTLVIEENLGASACHLSEFLAEIDERVNPLKPDTSEITARDREALADAIEEARSLLSAEELAFVEGLAAQAETTNEDLVAEPALETETEIKTQTAGEAPAEDEPALSTEIPAPSNKGAAYDTSVISRKALPPVEDEGRLVKTSHVGRAGDDIFQ